MATKKTPKDIEPHRSPSTLLVTTLKVLSKEIQSEDGVANAAIHEAAIRIEELTEENTKLRNALSRASKKCDHMHHYHFEYHRADEPCPVEKWVLGMLDDCKR